MKTLLIVEDEKHIRQGIAAMASRAEVPIERILTCGNGEEALEILEQEDRVDVMITDIRMPKMDGLTLIKRVQACRHVPLTVVVSGYDDFSYAVEVMRSGVRDYILKPVGREQLYGVLKKLDAELSVEEQQNLSDRTACLHALRYLMLDDNIPQKDFDNLMEQYSSQFFGGSYRAVCVNYSKRDDEPFDDAVVIRDMEHQVAYFLPEEQIKGLLERRMNERFVGVSMAHTGLHELRKAYVEAIDSRRTAFLQSRRTVSNTMAAPPAPSDLPEREIDQIVQMLGVPRWQECRKVIQQLLARAASGGLAYETMGASVRLLNERITAAYQNLAPLGDDLQAFSDLWAFDNATEYLDRFSVWMRDFSARIETEFEDYQNKQKIQQAVQYVRENYASGLNMATVSNYVSMNYSLFSLLFKQYTGTNFVNYLQNLRIEESKQLLRDTDSKVGEISRRTGFQDEKHFMKVFKSITGVTPSEYRKNCSLSGEPE